MLEELAQKKLSPVPTPRMMSVDEAAWQKWHKYVTNFVDIEKRKVIWNHDGRGKSTLDKFFKDLADLLHCRKRFILMQGRSSKRQRDVLEQLAELNSEVYRGMLLKEQFLKFISQILAKLPVRGSVDG